MSDAADPRAVLADYQAEQQELHDLLAALAPDAWSRPTPAEGWDVRDQVSHLADTEEVAHDTATGGPRQLNLEVERYTRGEDFTEAGCVRGRSMTPEQVLDWWWSAAARVRAALAALPLDARVPWGLGMGWQAFVTARLMEHWAHGLDIRAGVEAPSVDTARLRHVAWICHRALPYAFRTAGVEPPPDRTLRLELVPPEGAGAAGAGGLWAFGPDDATDVIAGPAGVWCRRAVQRIPPEDATALTAEGPLAELAVRHARAFL